MKLVIIHGVTGAIGSACLSLFASQEDTIVYGISRKAKDFRDFCIDRKLPMKTLICSLSGDSLNDHYPDRMGYHFAKAIQGDMFESIAYIHALGVYPFEVDKDGNRTVSNDNDGDGIDDRCVHLTSTMFRSFFPGISNEAKQNTHYIMIGGIADKYEPMVHMSWWKIMKRTKEMIIKAFENCDEVIRERCKVSLLNISSVLCPNELITRPFVFSETNADPKYWLRPEEVAQYMQFILSSNQTELFREYELFKKMPNFEQEYYGDEAFTPRKVSELFKK